MAIRIVIDTSLIINFFNEVKEVQELIEGRDLFVLIVTEIEVMSFLNITSKELRLLKQFLSECYIVDIEPAIKDIT